jgi:nucleotide-binding universal stress UspA family protein
MVDRLHDWHLRAAHPSDVSVGVIMRWLISTDGTTRSRQAAEFAASFIRSNEDEVVLLGVINRTGKAALTKSMDSLEELLKGSITARIMREGSTVKVIEDVACEQPFDFVVYASRGRRGFSKLFLGSVAARLAHELPCSVLIVRKPPRPLKKMLISTTLSVGRDLPIEEGVKLAYITGASVTILHVMSQIPLEDEGFAVQLEWTAEELISQRTREGKAFQRVLELAQTEGVEAQPLIRHGLVEDEILSEVVKGGYDLLVLGAHATAVEEKWKQFLIEDVTNSVLLGTRCPVLIVRR